MYNVYYKNLKTGKEVFVNSYNNAESAIHKIASCYNIDAKIYQLGEYYYFMKEEN